MGFRFQNLHLLYRSCISKLSHVNKDFHPNPMIQTLNSHLQDPSLTLSDRPIYKVSRRWHMGHFDQDRGIDQHHQHHLPGKDGENIFRLGLAADIFLASGKVLTGYLSGSTAIIADAAHSVSDVVTKFSLFLFSFLNNYVSMLCVLLNCAHCYISCLPMLCLLVNYCHYRCFGSR